MLTTADGELHDDIAVCSAAAGLLRSRRRGVVVATDGSTGGHGASGRAARSSGAPAAARHGKTTDNEQQPSRALWGSLSMRSLPLPARLYVGGVIAARRGAARRVLSRRDARRRPWLFLLLLALSSITSVFKVNLPLARERLDDVGVVRGGLRVAAAARAERDDGRGGGERLQPVHVPHQGAQPASPHALQHGVPGRHRAGGRHASTRCSAACPARSTGRTIAAAARRRRDDLLRRQHAGDRHRDRAVDAADDLQGLERELPLERAELLRRRRRRGRRRRG